MAGINLFASIGQAVKPAANAITSGFQSLFNPASSTKPSATSVLSGAANLVSTGLNALGVNVTPTQVASIPAAVASIAAPIIGIVPTAVTQVATGGNSTDWDSIVQKIQTALGGIGTSIGSALGGAVTSVTSGLSSMATTLWTNVSGWISTQASSAYAYVKKQWDQSAIGKGVNSVYEWIKARIVDVSTWWNDNKPTFQKIASGFKASGRWVGEQVQKLVEDPTPIKNAGIALVVGAAVAAGAWLFYKVGMPIAMWRRGL